MPQDESPPREPRVIDPEALARAFELELLLKRGSWQKAREQRYIWRALSLLFLLFVIVGALCAWFFLTPQLQEHKAATPALPTTR